jgi:hypothetical protein
MARKQIVRGAGAKAKVGAAAVRARRRGRRGIMATGIIVAVTGLPSFGLVGRCPLSCSSPRKPDRGSCSCRFTADGRLPPSPEDWPLSRR